MLDVADLLASLPPEAREAVLNGPAHAPPPGVIPNFDNPPSQNNLVIGVLTTGYFIVVILFFARVYSRLVCLKRVHVEDGMIISINLFEELSLTYNRFNSSWICAFSRPYLLPQLSVIHLSNITYDTRGPSLHMLGAATMHLTGPDYLFTSGT